MLQYSKAPVQAPFGDPPGRRPGQAARSASYGCRRGWPGGGKHLPSGRPPMDCGICRPFRAGGERKVLRRETGVLAAHFVAAAGGVFPSRGRRRSAGPGGGRLKVGEPEAKRTRWRPKPCGGGETDPPRTAVCAGGKATSPARPEGGPADWRNPSAGKARLVPAKSARGYPRVIIDRPLGGTEGHTETYVFFVSNPKSKLFGLYLTSGLHASLRSTPRRIVEKQVWRKRKNRRWR